jgi:hypothetical protein
MCQRRDGLREVSIRGLFEVKFNRNVVAGTQCVAQRIERSFTFRCEPAQNQDRGPGTQGLAKRAPVSAAPPAGVLLLGCQLCQQPGPVAGRSLQPAAGRLHEK